jgi:carboxymethylenebutenolidase
VSYYGSHPDPADAKDIKPPLMFHHGETDERINASWPGFEKALREADANFEEFMYAGAGHGFHNDTTPRYVEEAARLSWDRTTEFFVRHLELGE